MEREDLLKCVAPCSLLCLICTAHKDGPITNSAKALHTYLEGFDGLLCKNMPKEAAEGFSKEFQGFRDTLLNFTGASCHGCRAEPSLKAGCIEGCVIPQCSKAHGVDFCGECGDFPCEIAKAFFEERDPLVEEAWETGSSRLREIGEEAYFEEKKSLSHYLHYSK